MDSHCEEMDAADRLHILHDFYRVGEESEFRFDLRENMKNGHSFKDAICPDSMEFKKIILSWAVNMAGCFFEGVCQLHQGFHDQRAHQPEPQSHAVH